MQLWRFGGNGLDSGVCGIVHTGVPDRKAPEKPDWAYAVSCLFYGYFAELPGRGSEQYRIFSGEQHAVSLCILQRVYGDYLCGTDRAAAQYLPQ